MLKVAGHEGYYPFCLEPCFCLGARMTRLVLGPFKSKMAP